MSGRYFQDRGTPSGTKRRVIVAVDFGTSNTKLAFRFFDEDKVRVVTTKNPTDGLGPACWPSVVAISSGRLFFGDEASRKSESRILPSVKMSVAYQHGAIQETRREHLIKEVSQGSHVLYADDLATLYLGWAIGQVHDVLSSTTQSQDLRFAYNMGAPLDMVSHVPDLRGVFEKCLHNAVRLAGRVRQGLTVLEAMQLIRESSPVPALSQRNTFVVPETHCAITGAVLSQRLAAGHYIVVDVGAGTTDIATFWYSEGGDRSVTYYSASARAVASDDLCLTLVRYLRERELLDPGMDAGHAVTQVRLAMQRPSPRGLRLTSDVLLTDENCAEIMREPLEELFSHYRRVWFQGFTCFSGNRAQRHTWDPTHIVQIGGGTRIHQVHEALGNSPSLDHVQNIEPHELDYPRPMIDAWTGSAESFGGLGHMLIVLNGLAYHYAEMPQWYDPVPFKPTPGFEPEVDETPDDWW